VNVTYDGMEHCMDPATPVVALIEALRDEDWQIRFAAAVALGDRRESVAVESLLEALQGEDRAPLYSQRTELAGIPAGSPDGHAPAFPPGTTEETRSAWARRGRVKQAVCYALGEIGLVDLRVLGFLQRYATDQGEDYMVRAAANKALGRLPHPSNRPVLEQAAADPEWCTQTEGRKALAALT